MKLELELKLVESDKLFCHPFAKPYFNLDRSSLPKIGHPSKLSDEALLQLQQLNPTTVIRKDKAQFYFLANWALLDDLRLRSLPVQVMFWPSKSLTEEQIKELAWYSVFARAINGVNRHHTLSGLVKILQDKPRGANKLLLPEQSTVRSPVNIVQLLTDETRAAIRHQLNQNCKKFSDAEKTELERMLSDAE